MQNQSTSAVLLSLHEQVVPNDSDTTWLLLGTEGVDTKEYAAGVGATEVDAVKEVVGPAPTMMQKQLPVDQMLQESSSH